MVESLRWQDAESEQIASRSALWAAIQALLTRHRIASGTSLSPPGPGPIHPTRRKVGGDRLGLSLVRPALDLGKEGVGNLQSPFEELIVIVVREVQRGWEGPPNIEEIYPFGADLQKGS